MKNLKNSGTVLTKVEQKNVIGGVEKIKKEGGCTYTHTYETPCPINTSNSDGGCWITTVTC